MKKFTVSASAAALIASGFMMFSDSPPAQARSNTAGSFVADPVHSSINFKIRHAGASNFYGRFNTFEGSFTLDPDSPANSTFNFTILLESVDTGQGDRDNHLRSPDFFNTKQFAKTTFQSTFVELIEGGTYSVTGDLNLHGVTKEITAVVTHIADGTFRGSSRTGIEAKFEIKRADYGLTTYIAPDGGESGLLGNTVTILASFEGIKQ